MDSRVGAGELVMYAAPDSKGKALHHQPNTLLAHRVCSSSSQVRLKDVDDGRSLIAPPSHPGVKPQLNRCPPPVAQIELAGPGADGFGNGLALLAGAELGVHGGGLHLDEEQSLQHGEFRVRPGRKS